LMIAGLRFFNSANMRRRGEPPASLSSDYLAASA
jgi:hypothetical protein